MTNIVRENMVVSLAYTLKLKDGEVVDYSEAGEPLEYLHGAGNIIPGLESALEGMTIGQAKEIEIAPEDGYGVYDPEDVEVIDRAMLGDMPLEMGMTVMVSDEEDNEVEAFVRAFDKKTVTLDFNHPLAGQTLFFSVEVVDVREANEDELAHGHPHSVGFEEWEDEDEDYYDEDDEDYDDEDEDEDPRNRMN